MLRIQIFVILGGFETSAVPLPAGSCGAVKSPDCLNDMASCGNACCSAEFTSDLSPAELFDKVKSYLESGGSDGLFSYVSGAGGLRVSSPAGAWTSIFQGKHETFVKHYNDTLDFAVREAPGGSTIRIFSISDIAGALGDNGQNHRTVSMLGRDLNLGTMAVLFGCGSKPSLPSSVPAAESIGARPAGAAFGSSAMSLWIDRSISAIVGAVLTLVLAQAHAWRTQPVAAYHLAV